MMFMPICLCWMRSLLSSSPGFVDTCKSIYIFIYLGALNADVRVLSPLPKSQGFTGNALPQMAQQALNIRSVNELQAAAVVQKLIEQPWARSSPTN